MKKLLISLLLVSAFVSGCATSTQRTWVCEAGTCIPNQVMLNSYEKEAFLQPAYTTPTRF